MSVPSDVNPEAAERDAIVGDPPAGRPVAGDPVVGDPVGSNAALSDVAERDAAGPIAVGPDSVDRDGARRNGEQRDAVEPEPAFAAQLFGTSIETARHFARNLAQPGEELGLIGPLELPRLWTRHVANCALLAPLVVQGRVADIGSGAGLPGLVLAIARPDVQFVLIEPMERRVDWLTSQVAELGLTNVEVVRARAEEATNLPAFDQVTARAVSALSKLIPICAPLVLSGGELLFLKGSGVDRELEAASKAVKTARLWDVEVLTLGEEYGTEPTRVFRAKVD